MGLAYSDTVTQRLVTPHCTPTYEDAYMERRTFLGLVSKIVMGAALTPAELDLLAVAPQHTPTPHRVGNTDVTQLRVLTGALRAYDAAHGGGSCRDAILAHTQWAESLLTASSSDDVRPCLLSAVAEMKTLAGWTAHDLGLAKEARQYLTQAVQTTQEAENPAHSAIVLYYLGRVPLDNGDPIEALKLFQLGQIAAQDSRSATPVAFLLANEAVAYAHLGDTRQAMTALRRAEDEYAHATQEDQHPEFTRLFDHVALNTAAGRVHSRLGLTNAKHRAQAITRLNQAIADDDSNGRGRQRAFNLTWLAACTLAEGDLASGTQIGNQALDTVREMHSTRLLENLAPLQVQALRHPHDGDVRQLTHDLQLLRSAA